MRGNHGYTIEFHAGTIRTVDAHELLVEVTYRYDHSWEDYFKEQFLEKDTTSMMSIISIKKMDSANKPIFVYDRRELSFKSADDQAYSQFFALRRAEYGASEEV